MPAKWWINHEDLSRLRYDGDRAMKRLNKLNDRQKTDEINRLANLLFDTWKRVDPKSGVALYPASYMANFADMAGAIITDRKSELDNG